MHAKRLLLPLAHLVCQNLVATSTYTFTLGSCPQIASGEVPDNFAQFGTEVPAWVPSLPFPHLLFQNFWASSKYTNASLSRPNYLGAMVYMVSAGEAI